MGRTPRPMVDDDCEVSADVVSVLTEKAETITLDLCTCLAVLLRSQTERHLSISLELLIKLVRTFGSMIHSTVAAGPSSIGVDLQMEQRVEQCNLCFIELEKVKNRLSSLVRRKGTVGKTLDFLYDPTAVSGFDPFFNAITGLNGSGKSNILDSICFDLGITNLSSVLIRSLQELVYKQGQAGITRATVSIIFDNSDQTRSPIGYEDCSEITITRQLVIGPRSTYKINGHPAQPS